MHSGLVLAGCDEQTKLGSRGPSGFAEWEASAAKSRRARAEIGEFFLRSAKGRSSNRNQPLIQRPPRLRTGENGDAEEGGGEGGEGGGGRGMQRRDGIGDV